MIPNRFELIHIAAKRVKQMAKGSKPMVGGFHNKPAVMALREIAGGFVKKEISEGENGGGTAV
jgi:DNA-directed RNA polymerase subunit omega